MPRQSAYRSEVVSAPPRAVYASARNYTVQRGRGPRQQAGSREWQEAIWDYYDIVPEFRFAVGWVGNQLSLATLGVTQDGVPVTEGPAADAMAALFGGVEGQREMLRLLGIHFTAVGEAFIIGLEDQDEQEQWLVAAATEVSQTGGDGGPIRVGSEELPADSLVIRLWQAHPRKPKESDCPSRAEMSTLAELVGYSQYSAAQIDSRLTGAGVLLLPSEMELPTRVQTKVDNPGDPEVTQLELTGPEAFAQMLSDVFSQSISDRKSASRMTPVILQGPGEHLDKVKLLNFWSGLDENIRALRESATVRLARGMNMPPEVLTGTADVNHWGAWQIEEAAIKAHAEPLLDAICQAITDGYLRPYLDAEGVANPEDYDIVADTSQLRQRPNRSKEAIELFDRAQLSGAAMLRENGFEDSDAMDDAEKVQWFIQKVASGQTTPELVADALRLLQVPVSEPAATPPQEERPVRSLDDHPRRGAPDTEEQAAAASLDPLISAAEVMVFRALERAGNRLKARFGTPVDIPAYQLYLSVPTLSLQEAQELLGDAWSCVPQLGYDPALQRVLQDYTLGLMRLSKAHERDALERHLRLHLQTRVSATSAA